MKIVVCVEQVPDTETRVKIAPSGNAISEPDVQTWIVSPYDEFAIEEALRIKEAKGGEVVLVTVGPDAVDALTFAPVVPVVADHAVQGRWAAGGHGRMPGSGYSVGIRVVAVGEPGPVGRDPPESTVAIRRFPAAEVVAAELVEVDEYDESRTGRVRGDCGRRGQTSECGEEKGETDSDWHGGSPWN